MTIVQRWDRKEHKHVQVNCPAIVKEYNEHMGEVDVFDMLMSLYKVDHKSTEWYIRIFFWALNVAIINGWLLYRRHCQQLQQPICIQQDLAEFTSAISEALIHQNKLPQVVVCKNTSTLSSSTNLEPVSEEEQLPESKKRLVSVPARDVRFDNTGHLPTHCEPKQRCRVCKSYVRMKCLKCAVHLCITKEKNCYITYHTR